MKMKMTTMMTMTMTMMQNSHDDLCLRGTTPPEFEDKSVCCKPLGNPPQWNWDYKHARYQHAGYEQRVPKTLRSLHLQKRIRCNSCCSLNFSSQFCHCQGHKKKMFELSFQTQGWARLSFPKITDSFSLKAVKSPTFIRMVSPQGFSKAERISEMPPDTVRFLHRNEKPTKNQQKTKNTAKKYQILHDIEKQHIN